MQIMSAAVEAIRLAAHIALLPPHVGEVGAEADDIMLGGVVVLGLQAQDAIDAGNYREENACTQAPVSQCVWIMSGALLEFRVGLEPGASTRVSPHPPQLGFRVKTSPHHLGVPSLTFPRRQRPEQQPLVRFEHFVAR